MPKYLFEDRPYTKIIDGKCYTHIMGIRWFTNLDNARRHDRLVLWAKYNPTNYPKYDNYDAIEVRKIKEIPGDYDGIMGVPVSFLDKYNPDQFEILGVTDNNKTNPLCTKIYGPDDSERWSSLNGRAVLKLSDGTLKKQYARILIRRKQ